MAQLAWEDLLAGSDYDYNDFVGRMRATEIRNTNNELLQIQLTIKAIARAAGYDSDWQFNVDAALPTVANQDVIAIVDQFYADGTRHGSQRIYMSAGGMSVPVFTPIRDALPNPPGSYCTNGIPGTQYIDGDYAEVTVILRIPWRKDIYAGTLQARAEGSAVEWRPNLHDWPVDQAGRLGGLQRRPLASSSPILTPGRLRGRRSGRPTPHSRRGLPGSTTSRSRCRTRSGST